MSRIRSLGLDEAPGLSPSFRILGLEDPSNTASSKVEPFSTLGLVAIPHN